MKTNAIRMVYPFIFIALTACSQSQFDEIHQQLTSVQTFLSPEQKPGTTEVNPRNEVSKTFAVNTGVDTVAMRLKQYYGFPSDEDVAAARNNGQGNAGWSASAISEGASWSAQPGSYYRMSRNWAGNDRLTLDVRGDAKHSNITATYLSSTPEHLKPEWTARLWKQIPEVASGRMVTHGGAQ
ncbi:hypothetical protein [Citrobacter koseri]|uniref:hypothetical protein n=1 Tax=Citrobacter koseri TaxID=545 RepID=UPI000DFA467E|nr:hypothetical protein [Citrobacter koseri]STB73259.1 Uncharacterised protein [Citrobacter koseri]STT23440.1 Uncharacterised protein [Citrobacter koseri]